ncbi:MAG: response regulator [Deltaproteobacteria bacterium]|nr:response regulator [Deltaproteobacteria bacterium]
MNSDYYQISFDDKKKVLLVDDEPRMLESLSMLLESDYRTYKATNGLEAWNFMKKNVMDAIILDIVMPDMDGLDFLKRLRGEGNKVPVIIVTGKSCLEYAEKSAHLMVSGYFSKPYDIDRIMDRLNFLLKSVSGSYKKSLLPKKAKHPLLKKVMEHLEDNYTSPVSINGTSKKAGISSSHLSRLFKENLNLSFTQYINRLRVEKAKDLLEDKSLTINEIMNSVGFSTEQHFFKQFKRYTGTTPGRLRQLNEIEKNSGKLN